MVNLNSINGAALYLQYFQTLLVGKFKKDLVGVEMGIAYGGGVESLGTIWRDVGTVYGFDTFEGHPEFLADDHMGIEARCMDKWYRDDMFGRKALTYEFQRNQLDSEGLTNVKLVKGIVSPDSCRTIPKIHYCLLDMDILESMKTGYEAVKDKMVEGGYLFIHDAIPADHIPALHNWWYNEVMSNSPNLKVIGEWNGSFLVGVEIIK